MQYRRSQPFSTICVLAGSISCEVRASQIIGKLREQQSDVQIIGLGGDQMMVQGMDKNYGDINIFTDKPFFPQKYFRRVYIDQPIHPLMFSTHYQEWKQRNLMKKNGFYRDINYINPDAFLCLGNEVFMSRVYNDVHTVYQQNNKMKPGVFFYDKLIINQENRFKDYYDHMLYTLPNQPVNWQSFQFPSTFVGQQSVYEGLRYLFNRHRPDLVDQHSIMLPTEYYMEIVEEMVQKERNDYRHKMGFSDDHILVFLGAGNTVEEVKFTIRVVQESLSELLKRPSMNNLPSNNIKLIVSVPSELKWVIDDHMSLNTTTTQSELTTHSHQNGSSMFYDYMNPLVLSDGHEHLSAISASDLSLCITGQLSSTISALHSPLINLNYQPWYQSYFTSLYGQFENDINIASQGEVYSEKWCGWGGDAFGLSIAKEMEQFILQRNKRYQIIRRLDKVMKHMLPISQSEQSEQYSQNELVVRKTVKYQKYSEPDQVVIDKLMQSVNKYQTVKHNYFQRNSLLETLGHRVI